MRTRESGAPLRARRAERHSLRSGLRMPRVLRQCRAKVGLTLTLLVLAAVVLGPFVAPYSATEIVGKPFGGPNADSWLGTDLVGRDVLSRFLMGGRAILIMSLAATAVGIVTGIAAGLVAAYCKGWVDEAIMRFLDVVLSFPQLVLGLLFVSIVGPKLWLIALVIGFSHTPRVARVVRACALSVIEQDFVLLAETWGVSRIRILVGEVLPNIGGPTLVELGLRLIFSISLVSGMSFFGFGVQPPRADWGVMINENRPGLAIAPLPVLVPILAIAVLSVGINLLTDALSNSSRGRAGSSVDESSTATQDEQVPHATDS